MEFNSAQPIFMTIKEYYKHLIDIGAYKEGMEMPSVREVALANGINPNTVQRAFSLLVDEGYLVSIPKKGFFVGKQTGIRTNYLDERLLELTGEGYSVSDIEEALRRIRKK